jgi:hypothetical protein
MKSQKRAAASEAKPAAARKAAKKEGPAGATGASIATLFKKAAAKQPDQNYDEQTPRLSLAERFAQKKAAGPDAGQPGAKPSFLQEERDQVGTKPPRLRCAFNAAAHRRHWCHRRRPPCQPRACL